MIDEVMKVRMRKFELTNLGLLPYFFGLEIMQGNEGNFVPHQLNVKLEQSYEYISDAKLEAGYHTS